MASSSSSSPIPTRIWTHDVFLSFRGKDTRNSFVDHLYTALDQKGINVFKDDPALDKGKPISQELLKAIEESRFAVVVFSKTYADSSWCLDELVKIMECQDQMGQMVLPVFYHTDPSDVRGVKGDFDTAFQQHQVRFKGEMEKVIKWRKALAAAAGLSGWHIKETGNERESDIIIQIVIKILYGIRPCDMEKNLIGIESRIDKLYPLLCMEATKEVRLIGISGMGGIGKTTIAQALFRRISHKFEVCSFVEDVRENSSGKKGVRDLQEQILRDTLVTGRHNFLNGPEHGALVIRRRLCNKKVLLVLDDVDDAEQLEFLAGTPDPWFGPGSRIIITTRDEHLLSVANVIDKPDFLNKNEAAELFCWHAFRKSSPPEGYVELSERVIGYASGLPLALKVLGAFFRGGQGSVWESALDRLAEAPDGKILDKLKLSFDGLHVLEKQIFLDIACFFKGKDVEHVTRVLDSFGFHPVKGISVLIEKSLITVSNKKLDMHDLIQEMGWQIVRESESFLDSRLWKLDQIHDFIKGKKKRKAIEAIMMMDNEYLVDDYDGNLATRADVFARMKNLRLLDIDGKFTSTVPTFLPHELRWLRWTEYPFLTLPLADRCKLVGLEMAIGDLKYLWKGRKKCAAVNHRLSIAIPGSKIPSWIKQEKRGNRIALKLPHKWNTRVMGFVVCGVFRGSWKSHLACPRITFSIVSDGNLIPKSEVDSMMFTTETDENRNVWICYMPLGFFQQMYQDLQPEDWSLIEGNLDITVMLRNGTPSLRCGTHVISKEDVQQITTCISDYGGVVHVDDEDLGYD